MLSSRDRARIELRIAVIEKAGYPLTWDDIEEIAELNDILAGRQQWINRAFSHEFPTTIIPPDRNPYILTKLHNNASRRALSAKRGNKDLYRKGPRRFNKR